MPFFSASAEEATKMWRRSAIALIWARDDAVHPPLDDQPKGRRPSAWFPGGRGSHAADGEGRSRAAALPSEQSDAQDGDGRTCRRVRLGVEGAGRAAAGSSRDRDEMVGRFRALRRREVLG